MKPFRVDGPVTLYHGDCLDVLRTLPDESVDSVTTDPPYALEFMGRGWDKFTPLEFELWVSQWAAECLRVLKPGGHMLAFGGSRTWHRLAAGIEDAGFEIRDSIAWLYGSGFPKSLDVSKAIDKMRHDRSDVLRATAWLAQNAHPKALDAAAGTNGMGGHWTTQGAQAAVPTAEQWARISYFLPEPPDWFLALIKPARQPGEAWEQREITQEGAGAHRPGEVIGFDQRSSTDRERRDIPTTDAARTWEGWGTALKPAFEPIVVARKPLNSTVAANVLAYGTGALNIDASRIGDELITAHGGGQNGSGRTYGMGAGIPALEAGANPHHGRWPTNVVLDESQAAELDRQSGTSTSRIGKPRGAASGDGWGMTATGAEYDDAGGASRFFPTFRYEAKAPTSERPKAGEVQHPTVKPLDLMRWLVRLVTPPGGVVLEPFAGSGTTVEAAVLEGFQCIAIEREADYLPLIEQRLSKPMQQSLFDGLEGIA